jgi:hypothetical protein
LQRREIFFSPGVVFVLASCAPDAEPEVDPCGEPANAIVAENCLAGDPATEWDINGWGDPSIQGFGHDMSILPGETIRFKVLTDSDDYRLDIYRMGYYGGMGARRVDTVEPSAELPQDQPDCLTDPETRLFDCGDWAVSASWPAPADATSGIYFARLVREDPAPPGRWQNDRFRPTPQPEGSLNDPEWYRTKATMANALREPRASHIYFVVRDDDGGSDVLFQTSDMTWQAYNRYGGHSVYGRLNPERPRAHGGPPRAYKVSYNRPFETRDYRAVNLVFNSEYPMVRWLERNGYDVSYSTGIDSHRRGAELLEHRLFLSVGHDEYWSGTQRRNVEAARAAGVSLAFFSGNEVYWKVRWEDSIDPEGVPFRTLVTYKETQDHAKIDPLADVWTGTFADGRAFNPEGPWPENALTGTLFSVNAWRNDPLIVPAEYARLRFWRDTDVADLEPGERAVLLKGLLGHEWDSDVDNGFRPAGLFRLSETTIDNVLTCFYHGSTCDSGTATHHLVMYRHESGALVFGSGTVQWAWGLDAHHDTETGVPPERANGLNTRVGADPHGPDRSIQQATVNLFADMGVQPTTLQTELVAAAASTDSAPPTAVVTTPTPGQTIRGTARIEGTATDIGGGVVAGVEVSLDGGGRWHPANGREAWSYDWEPDGAGSASIIARAIDDSGNIGNTSDAVTITVSRGGS